MQLTNGVSSKWNTPISSEKGQVIEKDSEPCNQSKDTRKAFDLEDHDEDSPDDNESPRMRLASDWKLPVIIPRDLSLVPRDPQAIPSHFVTNLDKPPKISA